jgi:hypothetical protein
MPSPKTMLGRERATVLAYGPICTAPMCNKSRRAGSKYCKRCTDRTYFRGDVSQQLIPRKSINWARNEVASIIERNSQKESFRELMEVYEGRWNLTKKYLQEQIQRYLGGMATHRGERTAHIMLLAIMHHFTVEAALKEYAAWQYLAEFEPRLFTDVGLKHMVVKSFKAKAKVFDSSHIDKQTGKPNRRTPILYAIQREVGWHHLNHIFGAIGIGMYRKTQERLERELLNKQKITGAINELE